MTNFRIPQRDHPMFTGVRASWAGNLPTGKTGTAVHRATDSRGGREERERGDPVRSP